MRDFSNLLQLTIGPADGKSGIRSPGLLRSRSRRQPDRKNSQQNKRCEQDKARFIRHEG